MKKALSVILSILMLVNTALAYTSTVQVKGIGVSVTSSEGNVVEIIPKTSENGDDLSDKNFSIIIKNSGGVSTEIEVENPEILENYIKIKFSITEAVTEVSGNLTLQIQAKTNGDYIWKTYPAVFNIANSL